MVQLRAAGIRRPTREAEPEPSRSDFSGCGGLFSQLRREGLFKFGEQQALSSPQSPLPGTQPLQQVREGDTVQDVAGRSGRPDDWQQMAAANGIENPRRPAAGGFLEVRVGAGGRGRRFGF